MSTSTQPAARPGPRAYDGPIIDCDVHHTWRSVDELLPYLPAQWREYALSIGIEPPSLHYPFPYGTNKRLDTFGPDGARPGSSYELLREQLLDGVGVSRAVLSFDVGQEMSHPNPYLAAAVARAANDWSLDLWLGRDDRLYGAILVAAQSPLEAAAEIRRVGVHDRMVEVLLADNGIGYPFGHPVYHPIYEAAEELSLPVAVHFGSAVWGGTAQLSAGGLPLNRFEYYGVLNQAGMHHLASFLAHGVFDRFPGLRVLVLETGLNWVPWVVWQLDAQYDALRRENPRLGDLPSSYLARHVRLSTQPMEPGRRLSDQAELLAAIDGVEEMICFATDYPHWDADDIGYVRRHFPADWLPRLFHGNAERLYGWSEA